jgi:predicted amidohydrolase
MNKAKGKTNGGRGIRTAICQIFCLDGDREGNFARIEHALAEASEAEARLACFPESSLLGWVNAAAHQRACPIPGVDSDRLCRMAKQYGLYVCIGLDESDNGLLYGSAILIDPAGQILLKHRKIHVLPELMTPPYTPGNETDVAAVTTPLGRIGLLICADTFVPRLLDRVRALAVDVLLVPYGWAAPETQWPGHGNELHRVVHATATSIGAAVVGTDLVGQITCGPWAGQVYGGQSIAVDAQGNTLAIAADRDRDIQIVEIPVKEA